MSIIKIRIMIAVFLIHMLCFLNTKNEIDIKKNRIDTSINITFNNTSANGFKLGNQTSIVESIDPIGKEFLKDQKRSVLI